MDCSIILENKRPGLFHKESGLLAQKEIGGEYRLALCEFGLRPFEIELNAEAVDELYDGIGVLAVLHDAHKVFHESSGIVSGGASVFGGRFSEASLAE